MNDQTDAPGGPLPRATDAVDPSRPSGDSDAPAAMLTRLLSGAELDGDAMQWLARGFATWLQHNGDVSLPAALGLPGRPFLARIAMRDLWLQEAARVLATPEWARRHGRLPQTPWEVARRLRYAVESFRGGKWPTWRRFAEPPWGRCSELDACLFLALRSCDHMPESERQFFNIVTAGSETKGRADFTRLLQQLA